MDFQINSRFLFIVSNAGRKEHDSGLMLNTVDAFRAKGKVVDIKFFDPLEKALLAFQGPDASRVLQSLTPKTTLNELYFMTSTEAEVAGVSNCR